MRKIDATYWCKTHGRFTLTGDFTVETNPPKFVPCPDCNIDSPLASYAVYSADNPVDPEHMEKIFRAIEQINQMRAARDAQRWSGWQNTSAPRGTKVDFDLSHVDIKEPRETCEQFETRQREEMRKALSDWNAGDTASQ